MAESANTPWVDDVLRSVGAYQLEAYRNLRPADVRFKEGAGAGQSVVTEHDVETERRVFRAIEKHFPDDSLFGEETGNVRRDPDRYWVLDPIDGTSNFTQGIAYWGPSLAFVRGGILEAGWIYMPALDQMFHARRGEGALLNERPIRASDATSYSDRTTVATTSLLHGRFRLDVPAKQRILGSLIVNLAYLASGTFAAVYCLGRIWDLAAGILIAREAGALVECRPGADLLHLADLDRGSAPRITVFGRASERLPSLEDFLLPVEGR